MFRYLISTAVMCCLLSGGQRACQGQDQASGGKPAGPLQQQFRNPFDRATTKVQPGVEPVDKDAHRAQHARRSGDKQTDEERRLAIDQRIREQAAAALESFQAQSPAGAFAMLSGPEVRRLLRDHPADDEVRRLMKHRCRAALLQCQATLAQYQQAKSHVASVLESSRRFASSLLALEPEPKIRLRILRHNLIVAQEIEKFADLNLRTGIGTFQELHAATYERISAEIRLLQANQPGQPQPGQPQTGDPAGEADNHQ